MKKLLLFSIILIGTSFLVYGQKARKFGVIDKADVSMEYYEGDTSAQAVVLYDYGRSRMNYLGGKLNVLLNVHKIVKIFDDDEFDRADIEVKFPHGSNVGRLKAATYNLVEGKVVVSELDKKSVHRDKVTDGLMSVKFSLPDIKPGSVIEYSYNVSIGSITYLNNWYFQTDIPVKWSEYIVEYPTYFAYKTVMQGYLPINIADVHEVNMKFGSEMTTGMYHRYVAENVPAFVEEKYMTTRKNFLSKVDFELESINIPGNYYKRYFSDFNNIRKTLMEDDDFGRRLGQIGFLNLKNVINYMKLNNKSELELANTVYTYVQKHTNWNDKNSMYCTVGFRKVFDSDEDVSAGKINLFLTAMLREVGLRADPVILSTRSNGIVHPIYPLIKRYNYTITQVTIDGKKYLLDATDDHLPFNVLPERCLNGQGRVISELGSGWTPLTGKGTKSLSTQGKFELDEDGVLKGTLTYIKSGYVAADVRRAIEKSSESEYLTKYEEREGWQIEDSSIEGVEDINSNIKQAFSLEISDKADAFGDMIYLNPLVVNQHIENPFKLEKREYPVDFGSPIIQKTMISFKIPEGFEVEEMPEKKVLILPNKGGKFMYSASANGDVIIVFIQFSIMKTQFLQNEYPYIREFYAQIVEKEAEQIVLKRTS